ncbi:hypothetical protein SESBI_27705 [Sesbania bispinosa]|nr:hypothetical protein SESBI_27705 [Sesbania bispinosa]
MANVTRNVEEAFRLKPLISLEQNLPPLLRWVTYSIQTQTPNQKPKSFIFAFQILPHTPLTCFKIVGGERSHTQRE